MGPRPLVRHAPPQDHSLSSLVLVSASASISLTSGRMVQRRVEAAGIVSAFCCHSFRATGITTFLENGASLETAQYIAGDADSRTTKLYAQRAQRATLEDIERIRY